MNRLAAATSPYLRQHADNPVDWFEWGDEAFAAARQRDVPVLLSVGYAACHWCHVMAHESFEHPETAAQMNADFVNVKVDREERPDVDAVYMEAVQAMTGHGGWPMTAFLTPEGRVFYAGTYFPPEQRGQLPGFRQVLAAVSDAWRSRRDEVESTGRRISEQLGSRAVVSGPRPPDADELEAAVSTLAREYDHVHGGFGQQPKFPPSMALEWLLRHHHRTGRAEALRMVSGTCEAMARGGMYDQVGGGFARYSVDRSWVVPHFEKMLYDNALLLGVYTHWWVASDAPLARRVVDETAQLLLGDLRTPEGGFASALDADTDGVEGLTYVWTPEQLAEVLGPQDGAWAAELLSVTTHGTFEHGSSTLQMRHDPEDEQRWQAARDRLRAARAARPQPSRDDKVVAGWNGLAIGALAEAAVLVGEPRWLDAATETAALIADVHWDGSRLRRVSRGGVAGSPPGVLEDYAGVADGLLVLGGLTGEPRWVQTATGLLDVALSEFTVGEDVFDTAADATDPRLGRRPSDPTDNAYPSGRSALAHALLRAAALTGDERYARSARSALGTAQALATRAPRFVSWALAAAETVQSGPLEIAVVGETPADRADLLRAALTSAPPGTGVASGPADPGGASPTPLLRHRDLRGGDPAAYVCRDFVCRLPVTTPDDLRAALAVSRAGR